MLFRFTLTLTYVVVAVYGWIVQTVRLQRWIGVDGHGSSTLKVFKKRGSLWRSVLGQEILIWLIIGVKWSDFQSDFDDRSFWVTLLADTTAIFRQCRDRQRRSSGAVCYLIRVRVATNREKRRAFLLVVWHLLLCNLRIGGVSVTPKAATTTHSVMDLGKRWIERKFEIGTSSWSFGIHLAYFYVVCYSATLKF